MHAKTGDWLVVYGPKVDHRGKRGRILEVRSADGTPPYRVKWLDGNEALVFPGPDAEIIDTAVLREIDENERERLDFVQQAVHRQKNKHTT
ncbi:DUF1918 domain-containing protein [Fodinicola acaciae]|uniref:DUF1918 domain-containing protein n=1 Tax=Fodinicola acaciae TaxID=2681555 RepID=UPI0013D844A3|nr:DUF1918 domain-containing protein [Fodinicola acaciae]